MPTILHQLRDAFRAAIRAAYDIDADPMLVPTGNEKFGDYQCNIAMALAKTLKLKPRDVAEKIKSVVDLANAADKLEIAGPGFINVFLSPKWVEALLITVAEDARLGVDKKTNPQTVIVDYSGPNIAKEMHVGHFRATIIGDACAKVMEFAGDNVIRQNHLGDWGTQFGMLIANLVYRPAGEPASTDGLNISDLDAFYKAAKQRFDSDELIDGRPFADRARELVVRLQSGDPEVVGWWKKLIELSRKHFAEAYERLHISLTPADERGESFYNPMLKSVVDDLKQTGLAVETDGAIGVFIDGPDRPPVLVEKSGGGYLYATTDLAAVRYRVNELHADRVVYFTDSRQSQHFAQVFRVAEKAGWTKGASFEHAPFGTILGKDGKPFKSRSGETVKLKDLLDEAVALASRIVEQKNPDMPADQKERIATTIGIGAVKYGDLVKDRTSDYVFDWDTMLAMDGNTAPYIQYAYARIQSIFRRGGVSASADAPIALNAPEELALAKHILRLGEVIDAVTRELKPHLLCAYLYELATRFSGFFENCPVLKSEEPARSSRLALCAVTARTMALGLDLLGIEHPDQM